MAPSVSLSPVVMASFIIFLVVSFSEHALSHFTD